MIRKFLKAIDSKCLKLTLKANFLLPKRIGKRKRNESERSDIDALSSSSAMILSKSKHNKPLKKYEINKKSKHKMFKGVIVENDISYMKQLNKKMKLSHISGQNELNQHNHLLIIESESYKNNNNGNFQLKSQNNITLEAKNFNTPKPGNNEINHINYFKSDKAYTSRLTNGLLNGVSLKPLNNLLAKNHRSKSVQLQSSTPKISKMNDDAKSSPTYYDPNIITKLIRSYQGNISKQKEIYARRNSANFPVQNDNKSNAIYNKESNTNNNYNKLNKSSSNNLAVALHSFLQRNNLNRTSLPNKGIISVIDIENDDDVDQDNNDNSSRINITINHQSQIQGSNDEQIDEFGHYQTSMKKKELMYQYAQINNSLATKANKLAKNYPTIDFESFKRIWTIWNIKIKDENKVAVNHDYIPEKLSYYNLKTLSYGKWLNDEVVNAYVRLINNRNCHQSEKQIYVYNTFIYPMLEKGEFDKVCRATKRAKVMITNLSGLFFPININNTHWIFVHVNKRKGKIMYNDSLRHDSSVAQRILKTIKLFYLQMIKKESDECMNDNSEVQSTITTINLQYPKQTNLYDCGVFMLKGIEFLSRNAEPNFESNDIPFFRILITNELLLGRLLTE